MKINYVDPGLNELAGHHFAYAVKILDLLKRQGHDVVVYCHTSAHPNVVTWLSQYCPIQPIFEAFPYPTFSGQQIDFEDQVLRCSQQFESLRSADVIMFSSLFPFHLAACKNLSNIRIVGCCHGPDHNWPQALELTKHLEKTVGVTNTKLYGDFQNLSSAYTDIKLLPLLETDDSIGKPKHTLSTVGFFGCQRTNKGDYIIKDIVERLHRQYKITVHDGWDRLKINLPNVTNIGFVENIFNEIKKCDLVIFPHNEDYEKRISGVFIHCVSLGIPCLVPNNTTLSDVINISQGGLVFDLLDAEIISNKLTELDYNSLAQNAYNYSLEYNKENTVEKFIQALLCR